VVIDVSNSNSFVIHTADDHTAVSYMSPATRALTGRCGFSMRPASHFRQSTSTGRGPSWRRCMITGEIGFIVGVVFGAFGK